MQEREKCVCVCLSIYTTDVREADQDPKLRQTRFLKKKFWSTMQEQEEHHLRLT
jgi:hypothetical protein